MRYFSSADLLRVLVKKETVRAIATALFDSFSHYIGVVYPCKP